MRRDLRALADTTFDVLVIGGGASGAACAREAALRGLSTALIEREDFGAGASAHCFKVVHGGIRYLQHGDVKRLRSSCRERAAFLRIAPHLVSPLSFAVPTFGQGRSSKWFLGTGMLLYDALTADLNRSLPDPARRVARTQFLDREETLERFPSLAAEELTGAAVFQDGQMYSPPRLVLALAQTAAVHGSVVANYVEATSLLLEGNAVVGVQATDKLGGGTFPIRARMVINAAGPWAESVLSRNGRTSNTSLGAFSRDTCFLVERPLGQGDMAVAVPGRSRDADAVLARSARHMFLVPWRGATLVGVWHGVVPTQPDTVGFRREQLREYLDEINHCYPGLELGEDDVRIAGFGLVPFGDPGKQGEAALSFGKESRFIDHRESHGISGLVTCVSVRYTVARADGQAALDLAAKQLSMPDSPPASLTAPVPGGNTDDFAGLLREARRDRPAWLPESAVDPLVRNFGTLYPRVLRMAVDDPSLARCVEGTNTSLAEVAYVVRNEQAQRLADVLFRRTDLGTRGHPGAAVVGEVEHLMARELGWDEARRAAESTAVQAHLRRYLAAADQAGL